MQWKSVTGIVVAALMGACGTPVQREQSLWTPLPFDEAEYAALPKSGTGVVRGQVFAKTVGGEVKKGAGEEVLLIPATKYRDQWYSEKVLQGKGATAAADPRYSKYDRLKISDGDGRFEFIDVPPGTYYVLGRVVWEVVTPSRFGPIHDPQGGMVTRKVSVENGKVTEAILSYN